MSEIDPDSGNTRFGNFRTRDYLPFLGRSTVEGLLLIRYQFRERGTSLSGISVLWTIYRSGEGHRRGIASFQVSIPIQGTSVSGGLRTLDYLPFRGGISSGNCFLSDIDPDPGNVRFGSAPYCGLFTVQGKNIIKRLLFVRYKSRSGEHPFRELPTPAY